MLVIYNNVIDRALPLLSRLPTALVSVHDHERVTLFHLPNQLEFHLKLPEIH
jgi:hypothetical protein